MVDVALSHVAVLVRSLDHAAGFLKKHGLFLHDKEFMPGEGTAEIYVGEHAKTARLLIVEAVSPGPYTKALKQRGPGLHHIGIDAHDLNAYVEGLNGSGWYLLPQSLRTIHTQRTAWLARPGTPLLIEVHERRPPDLPAHVAKLALPLNEKERRMVAALGVSQLTHSHDQSSYVTVGGATFKLTDLLT